MTPIDLSTSIVGEIFPLVINQRKPGRLGLVYLDIGELLYTPGQRVDHRSPCYLCTTGNTTQVDFKWRITPLLNGKVIITCTHPADGNNYMLNCRDDIHLIRVIRADLPAYYEEVMPESEFEIEYLASSPMIFKFKTTCGRYIARQDNPRQDRNRREYFEVDSIDADRIYYEGQFREPGSSPQYYWYIEPDKTQTHPNALNAFASVNSLNALINSLGININEANLKTLTVG